MIEFWVPGVLVRDFALEERPGVEVVDTRLVGRGSAVLVRAKESTWEIIATELLVEPNTHGAATRSAMKEVALRIRDALDRVDSPVEGMFREMVDG